MSADQTIIAWKHHEEAVASNGGDIAEEEADKIQHSALELEGVEGDEGDEVGDEFPRPVTQTETQTGGLSTLRTVSIGSFDGATVPGGAEEDIKTVKKKSSLCSTLSSGDQPYLSLISSQSVRGTWQEVDHLVVFQAPTVAGKSLKG